MRSIQEQVAILMQGAEYGDDQIYQTMKRELEERLAEGRPLRVYCGFDPTAPDIHLGHTVPMRKLRQFQELGHEVTFLIGTFTGLIGDPSDKNTARAQQTPEDVKKNAMTYAEQAFKILDREKTLIRYNGDWLGKLSFADVIKLASNFTVQQFLARDNFSNRYANGDPIWLHEFFYALMQGYDAVAMDTDVQIGATEQLFNLLAGRKLQESFGQKPQICITFPILVGTDGHVRMSKSTGNYIGIDESPNDQYGKVMSLPDDAMPQFFRLVTRYEPPQIEQIVKDLESGKVHPRDVKMKLAYEIVSIFHGEEEAAKAEAYFKQVFQQQSLPDEMPVCRISEPVNIIDLIAQENLANSKSDARRLIQQNAVSLDNVKIESIETMVEPAGEQILRVGRRRFLKIIADTD